MTLSADAKDLPDLPWRDWERYHREAKFSVGYKMVAAGFADPEEMRTWSRLRTQVEAAARLGMMEAPWKGSAASTLA